MNRFEVFRRIAWSILVVGSLSFAISGCEGDDGRDGAAGAAGTQGPAGPAGPEGPAGPGASVIPLESCAVCHSDGSFVSAPAAHAIPPIEMVSNVTFAVDGADLDVTFDLAVDGAPGLGYDQVQRGYRTDGTTRFSIVDTLSLTDNGGGNYTITIAGGAAEAANDNRYLFRVAAGSDRETRVYLYGDFPASPVEDLAISAAACTNCHGPEGIDVHGGYFAATDGGEPCLACHGVEAPDRDTGLLELIPRLVSVAHEYHIGLRDEITYPTYMNNCSVCHSEAAELAAANAMPIAVDGCLGCHGSLAGIPFSATWAPIHAGFDETTDCQGCHVAGGIASTVLAVTDVHNGATTGRGGVIWDGVDTSVTEGALFDWEITGVTDDGTNLTITWQASYDAGAGPVGVDPCNATPAAGAPAFHAIPPFTFAGNANPTNRNNLSILRSYAQGEDFILSLRAGRAGQPNDDVDLDDINTTCAGNVATTVVPVEATEATVGRVAIQGKPWVVAVDPDDEDGVMQVRAKTPTYDWVIGDGSAAPPRRAVADTSLCLNCHVGSLYQHGGNRVDNLDMCYLCHNAAANDEYVRVDNFGGVDASEAYDGRAGQAFGIKEMVHAVHPSGATGNPLVIYRGRGIYGWADDVSKLSNWPTGANCTDGRGRTGSNYFTVVGSDPATATSDTCQPHNFHVPTYPRGLYDCAACHVQDDPATPDTDETFVGLFPDATKAMATTVEAGAPPFEDKLNDVLQGVQTSSCVTCHADNATKSHAWQNSWVPQEFPEGRQTIIDAN